LKRILILYSGGTDSTAAAALVAERHDNITLVTYRHAGISNVGNSRRNIVKLRETFPLALFSHELIDFDPLFRLVTYHDYLGSLRRHGFFTLTTCGLCKLSMHLRTVIYCREHGIEEVADGANKNMPHFPDQMRETISCFKRLYLHFGITYSNPVFDYAFPADIDWIHKLGVASLYGAPSGPGPDVMTTGRFLHRKGILPAENVKGTALDRTMQARCFQLTLLNAFALGYYIPTHGMNRYREGIERFYNERADHFIRETERYLDGDRNTAFARAVLGCKAIEPHRG
jgi:hypothetical protein